jgi:hypothetical protein
MQAPQAMGARLQHGNRVDGGMTYVKYFALQRDVAFGDGLEGVESAPAFST